MSGLWLGAEPLVLASGSATRRLLLEGAGIPLAVRPATIDERVVEEPLRRRGAPPAEIARHLAREKALAVSREEPGRLVLGADQTLALGENQLNKPANRDEAARHLRAMSGRTHVLHAAWALARDGRLVAENSDEAHLAMRELTETFIDRYLATEGDAALQSVGSYRLEGLGVHLFRSVTGAHSTILGLPLPSLLSALRQEGLILG